MAGSYKHCTNDDGSFRADLIENLGDAREALEEMHGMIRFLARGEPMKIDAAWHGYMLINYPHHHRECAYCQRVAKEIPLSEQNTSYGSRQLDSAEQARIKAIREKAQEFRQVVDQLEPNRAMSLAKTKIDEAEMWAVKAVTG